MSLYDDLQPLVREILGSEDFKQEKIEYVKTVPGAGPVDEPGAPTITRIDLDAVARGAQFKYVARGLALATDIQVTAAVNPDVDPTSPHGAIEINNVRFKIVAFEPKPRAGTPVAWLFFVRRGV